MVSINIGETSLSPYEKKLPIQNKYNSLEVLKVVLSGRHISRIAEVPLLQNANQI